MTPLRWAGLFFCLVGFVLAYPISPSATRFQGRYVGSPVSDCRLFSKGALEMKAECGGRKYSVAINRALALSSAGLTADGWEIIETPVIGIAGHELDVYGSAKVPNGVLVRLVSHDLWFASPEAGRNDWLWFASTFSYIGPVSSTCLIVFGLILFLWRQGNRKPKLKGSLGGSTSTD